MATLIVLAILAVVVILAMRHVRKKGGCACSGCTATTCHCSADKLNSKN